MNSTIFGEDGIPQDGDDPTKAGEGKAQEDDMWHRILARRAEKKRLRQAGLERHPTSSTVGSSSFESSQVSTVPESESTTSLNSSSGSSLSYYTHSN